MKDFQRIGGVGAVYQAVFLAAAIVWFVAGIPAMGLTVDDVVSGSDKALAAQATNATYATVSNLLSVGGIAYAAAIVVLALALYERWSDRSTRLATIAAVMALIASTAYLCLAVTLLVGTPLVVRLYGHDTQATAAFVAFNAVTIGLRSSGRFALGLFLIAAGWLSLRVRDMPRPLGYLGLLAGVGDILGDAVIPLGVLGGILGIVWLAWLGTLLVGSRARIASPAGSGTPATR